MILPTHKNTAALKKPWVYKYKITYSGEKKTLNSIKNPQWLIVEYARVLFTSDWYIEMKPPIKAVKEPINGTTKKQ